MKLADRTVEVHSVGINSANQFSIAQTSKMFKILSDSLYSDKVMAVIRELATNAHDSHVSAGNHNPFLVKLPTSADPNFSVRDYGTGLSREDMESLYTTYGASNKNDSNDFVGCLGLGSKSPFAYTKSFTTTSYFDGMQYTYIAAIDDAGVPNLNLIHSCETSEPNGLEIGFAVKTHDFSEFSRKAVRVFHYFKQKPTITGGVDWDFTNYSNKNIVINGQGWRVCRVNNDNNLFPNHYHKVSSVFGIIAIMGNIAYPVDAQNLTGVEEKETPNHIAKWNRAFNKADIASWKAFVGEIINQGLYLELDFGIGELEMDVSREGLQYTKQVIKNLREKTQSIYLELKQEFSKKIAQAKTKVEAITTYYDLNDLAGGWGVGASWTDSDGEVHNINSGDDLDYKFKDNKNLYVFNYKTSGYRSRRLVYLTDRIHQETLTGKGSYYWNSSRKAGTIKFFYCDISTVETAKKIATKFCNQNDCFAYLLVDTKDHTDVKNGFDQLVKDVGADSILNISDYRDLIKSNSPRKTTTSNSKGSVSDQDVFYIHGAGKKSTTLNYEYNDAAHLRTLTESDLEDFLDQDQIVYVPIVRYGTDPDCVDVPNIWEIVDLVKDNPVFKKDKIYAIKKQFLTKLENSGANLVSFNDYLKTKLESFASSIEDSMKYISVIEFCNDDYNQSPKRDGYHYAAGIDHLEDQFTFHMLNIFGLDYAKYIKNDILVQAINHTMIIDYFANRFDKSSFGRFSQKDYQDHIQTLIKDIGLDFNVTKVSKDLTSHREMKYNLKKLFSGCEKVGSDFVSIIDHKTKCDNKIIKSSVLRENIKREVDNNPMLKYILGTNEVDGKIDRLKAEHNPIRQIVDDGSYYSRFSDKWLGQMDNIELFRVQLSSLIK